MNADELIKSSISIDNEEGLSDVTAVGTNTKSPDETDFVLVIDPNDNEPVEIPMDSDGTLQLMTLEHAFPGAYGLKYTNPLTGVRRVVSLDANGLYFCPPSGGWKGKTFSIIFRPLQNVREVERKVEQAKAKRKREHENGEDEIEEAKSELSEESVRDGEESRNGGEELDVKGEQEREREQARKGKKPRKEWVVDGVPKNCSDLYVVGIPYDLEEEALKQYFEQFGSVELSEIKRDKQGLSRGFGFIRMAQYDGQVQVLSKPTHFIGGRECQTRISSTDKAVDNFTNRSLTANPRVFVGNLEEDIGKDRLREFFLEHIRRLDKTSDIVDLYYPKPFRYFAFLTLSSSLAAKELVRQRDFIIDGSTCEVTVAAPRKRESESQFGVTRHLPFGAGIDLISAGDPRWNTAVSSSLHPRQYSSTVSGGTHLNPYLSQQQQQRNFDGEQSTRDHQRLQLLKQQNDLEANGAHQQTGVWSAEEYHRPRHQLTAQNSAADGVRQQCFLPPTSSSNPY